MEKLTGFGQDAIRVLPVSVLLVKNLPASLTPKC